MSWAARRRGHGALGETRTPTGPLRRRRADHRRRALGDLGGSQTHEHRVATGTPLGGRGHGAATGNRTPISTLATWRLTVGHDGCMERCTGLEPVSLAWKASCSPGTNTAGAADRGKFLDFAAEPSHGIEPCPPAYHAGAPPWSYDGMVDRKGIEPSSPACKAGILPLNYQPMWATTSRPKCG